MGQPGGSHIPSFCTQYIGTKGERGELKHLSTCRKRNQHEIVLVAASERARAQTSQLVGWGCRTPTWDE